LREVDCIVLQGQSRGLDRKGQGRLKRGGVCRFLWVVGAVFRNGRGDLKGEHLARGRRRLHAGRVRRVVRVLGEALKEGDLLQAAGANVLAVSDPEPVVGHHLGRVTQVTHDPVVKSVLAFVRVNLEHVCMFDKRRSYILL
jgi:hypothetical protein